MSFMDNLTQMASQELGGENAGAAGHLMDLVNSPEVGGVSGLVAKFHQNGLGDVVNSWVGNGENQQVAADKIEQVIGADKVNAIAGKLGVSPDEAKAKIAALLPQVINKLTPAGKVASA
jgi:uncharacterized protein YidB (DUF937 family)